MMSQESRVSCLIMFTFKTRKMCNFWRWALRAFSPSKICFQHEITICHVPLISFCSNSFSILSVFSPSYTPSTVLLIFIDVNILFVGSTHSYSIFLVRSISIMYAIYNIPYLHYLLLRSYSIMYAIYSGYNPNNDFELGWDDRKEIQSIYGKSRNKSIVNKTHSSFVYVVMRKCREGC